MLIWPQEYRGRILKGGHVNPIFVYPAKMISFTPNMEGLIGIPLISRYLDDLMGNTSDLNIIDALLVVMKLRSGSRRRDAQVSAG